MEEIAMDNRGVQPLSSGVGPCYHRVYSVEVEGDRALAAELMHRMQLEIDSFSPQWIAHFKKRNVEPGRQKMKVGDEFDVKLSAPWDAPVRVEEVTENSICLKTLKGHIEAGEIHFRVRAADEGRIRFEIESLARSKTKLVDFLYDKLPIARFAQFEMWSEFCMKFAETAAEIKGRNLPDAKVEVLTERQDEETGQWIKI